VTGVHETAVLALAHGFSVIPAATNGTKAPWPDGPRWAKYQKQPPTPTDVERWFAGGKYHGMGVVCGAVSGGLEMLEFEGRAIEEGVLDAFLHAADAAGLVDLVDRVADGYQEQTPAGGLHWLYRCDTVAGNTKLASRPATGTELEDNVDEKIKVLIETRGEGGFVVTAPSNGATHPSGRPWELVLGGFDTVATITTVEREELHELARLFDRVDQPKTTKPATSAADTGARPGDDYNTRTSWPELLEPHGWVLVFERSGVAYWRRPGKDRGISATTNALGTDRLKVFSSSTAFDTQATYDRFGAYAHLEHSGDITAAAKTLRGDGFGSVPTRSPVAGEADPGFECSDLGNARRLAATYGDKLRYVPEWGRWLAWDGRRWARDITGEVHRHAKQVVDSILDEAAQAPIPARREKLAKWWMQSQSAARLSATVLLAATEPGIPVEVAQLDADPWLLNVSNGTVDLRTGLLHPPKPAELLTKLAPVAHNPDAACPTFMAFLEHITAGDTELMTFLQCAVGYSLTGLVNEQTLFFCHGGGANGKTTLMTVLEQLLGDYAIATAPNLLINTGDNEHPTAIADLVGVRMAVSQEVEEGRRLAESTVKQLTGGDTVKARFMRQDFFEFRPTHKLWLCANHRPFVRGTDHAIWRRIRLIPFTVTIPPEQQDKQLGDKLADELPGILNWAVAGCLQWQREGLGAPATVNDATSAYRNENDTIGRFIDECCVTGDGFKTAARDLRECYVAWCEDNGERPMSQRALAPHLHERGLESVKDRRSHSWWFGIAVTEGARAQPSEQDLSETRPIASRQPHYPHSAGARQGNGLKGGNGARQEAAESEPDTLAPRTEVDSAGIEWDVL
jgi:putative DNA primase/helicase